MKNAIVVCATPNWLAPAAVTLLSCSQHGAAEFADLILVSFQTNQDHLSSVEFFNKKHSTSIRLLDVKLNDLEGMGQGRLGIGSLLRLKLNEFLPGTYERILYLDSDVLAEGNCFKLFELNLDGHTFAAVENTALLPLIKSNATKHKTAIGMQPSQKYFNAGVMLFDWQKTCDSKFMYNSLELMKQNANWPFQDQDALNSVAQGQWKMLDHSWNVTKKTADYLKMKPRFRHFNGAGKPWNSKHRFGFARYHKYYVESLNGTPWQSFMSQSQRPWPIKENWRALLRKLSFTKIAKLRHHVSLVAEKV
jgi:lipopolysaccharide biosynthesis glycosyltransferase